MFLFDKVYSLLLFYMRFFPIIIFQQICLAMLESYFPLMIWKPGTFATLFLDSYFQLILLGFSI